MHMEGAYKSSGSDLFCMAAAADKQIISEAEAAGWEGQSTTFRANLVANTVTDMAALQRQAAVAAKAVAAAAAEADDCSHSCSGHATM